jgi:hypothetical protein
MNGEDGVADPALPSSRRDEWPPGQEDFEEADDAGLVDLDAGIANRTDGDRQGQGLEQREGRHGL